MKRQILIVKGIVIKDTKLLMVQRKHPDVKFDGLWELPGGKVDLGETLEDACVREVAEEAGIVCSSEKIIIDNYKNYSESECTGNHLVIIPVKCNYISKIENPIPDHNVKDVKWIPLNEVKSLNLLGGTLEMLKDFI